MTSQNSTLRCAASTMYSMAGANMPSGGAAAPIEDGALALDGIVSTPWVCLSASVSRSARENDPAAAHPHFSVMATSPGIPPGKLMISTLSLYPRWRKYFAQS